MNFENKNRGEVWEYFGYFSMYLIFTGVLYFLLFFLGKLPSSWNFGHVMGITLIVVFLGKSTRRFLK